MNMNASEIARRIAEIEHQRKKGFTRQLTIKDKGMVIDMQLDPDAAKSIRSAGGGAVVLKQALATIRGNVRLT